MSQVKRSVAVIGAGFGGMTASLEMAKAGWKVVVFEKEGQVGGLANGFSDKNWEWPLEKHYHHLFASDRDMIDLAKEIGHPISYTRPITSTYLGAGQIYQLDSPLSLLQFAGLSFLDRLRTGVGLAILRYNPFWQLLENVTAQDFIVKIMGRESWEVLWKPLFLGKFGKYADRIGAVWFWARIFTRTASLGYPQGGFTALALTLKKFCEKQGVRFYLGKGIESIKKKDRFTLWDDQGKKYTFDRVICTLPSPLFFKITPQLPKDYRETYRKLKGIGAVNLVLALKQKFLPDDIYWLNINGKKMPFLAIVEHTNFISDSHYNGDKLLYIGNYLPSQHNYFSLSADELLRRFIAGLKKINPDFDKNWVKKVWVWKAHFAQPIVIKSYAKTVPPFKTPMKGLYLCNIQQLHPWERGTNYAIMYGKKVAKICIDD